MYSTEYGEFAHENQIKNGWRKSNKSEPERQIIHSCGRLYMIRMRLLTLHFLQRRRADLPADVLEALNTMSTDTVPAPRYRILKGRWNDVTDVMDLCQVMEIFPESFNREFS